MKRASPAAESMHAPAADGVRRVEAGGELAVGAVALFGVSDAGQKLAWHVGGAYPVRGALLEHKPARERMRLCRLR